MVSTPGSKREQLSSPQVKILNWKQLELHPWNKTISIAYLYIRQMVIYLPQNGYHVTMTTSEMDTFQSHSYLCMYTCIHQKLNLYPENCGCYSMYTWKWPPGSHDNCGNLSHDTFICVCMFSSKKWKKTLKQKPKWHISTTMNSKFCLTCTQSLEAPPLTDLVNYLK